MEHAQDIINECWRSIDGNVNYQVSNTYRVRNAITGKILSNQAFDSGGYAHVGLCKDGIRKFYSIHCLVAMFFFL